MNAVLVGMLMIPCTAENMTYEEYCEKHNLKCEGFRNPKEPGYEIIEKDRTHQWIDISRYNTCFKSKKKK